MRNLYLLLLAGLTLIASEAQAFNVTFQLDLNNSAISPMGPHIAGAFQGWDPGATALTDDNCDFIYEVTLDIAAGDYEFKFVNGNAWGSDETQIPAACTVAGGGNRIISVTGDQVYGPVCFNDCAPCISTMPISVPVTLRVDMSLETVTDVVSVAGSFQAAAGLGADWTPGAAPMTDPDGDHVYEVSFMVPPGCYAYKFINGDAWGEDEGTIPAGCDVGGNREFRANDIGLDQTAICYKQCGACPTTIENYDLTFQVDLSRVANIADLATAAGIEGFELSDTISVAGSFQSEAGFNDWTPGATQLTDPDGDKIYTLTVNIPQGTYQYKFINGTSWDFAESVPGECNSGGNRQLELTANTTLPVVCFGYCEAQCPAALPPVDVTFRVEMNDEIVNANGLFVAGSFQRPQQWVKDVMAMQDPDGNGIFEFTYTIFPGNYQYKYYNGPGGDADGETYNFEADGCGTGNGLGGYNRTLNGSDFTGNYLLPAYKYNSCQEMLPGGLGIETPAAQIQFAAKPNPFTHTTVLEFDNANNSTYTLTISDMTGKIVRQITDIKGNSISIERNNLPSGIYYATLVNAKGERGTQKLLVD